MIHLALLRIQALRRRCPKSCEGVIGVRAKEDQVQQRGVHVLRSSDNSNTAGCTGAPLIPWVQCWDSDHSCSCLRFPEVPTYSTERMYALIWTVLHANRQLLLVGEAWGHGEDTLHLHGVCAPEAGAILRDRAGLAFRNVSRGNSGWCLYRLQPECQDQFDGRQIGGQLTPASPNPPRARGPRHQL